MRVVRICTFLVACLSSALLVSSFDVGHHIDLTKQAALAVGLSSPAANLMALSNALVSFIILEDEMEGRRRLQSDSDFLRQLEAENLGSTATVSLFWDNLLKDTEVEVKRQATLNDVTDQQSQVGNLLTVLGRLLHGVQAFYSHSNWRSVHPSTSCTCMRFETWPPSQEEIDSTGYFTSVSNDRLSEYRELGMSLKDMTGNSCTGRNINSADRDGFSEAYTFAFVATVKFMYAVEDLMNNMDPSNTVQWNDLELYAGTEQSDRLTVLYELKEMQKVFEAYVNSEDDSWSGLWKGSGSATTLEHFLSEYHAASTDRHIRQMFGDAMWQMDLLKLTEDERRRRFLQTAGSNSTTVLEDPHASGQISDNSTSSDTAATDSSTHTLPDSSASADEAAVGDGSIEEIAVDVDSSAAASEGESDSDSEQLSDVDGDVDVDETTEEAVDNSEPAHTLDPDVVFGLTELYHDYYAVIVQTEMLYHPEDRVAARVYVDSSVYAESFRNSTAGPIDPRWMAIHFVRDSALSLQIEYELVTTSGSRVPFGHGDRTIRFLITHTDLGFTHTEDMLRLSVIVRKVGCDEPSHMALFCRPDMAGRSSFCEQLEKAEEDELRREEWANDDVEEAIEPSGTGGLVVSLLIPVMLTLATLLASIATFVYERDIFSFKLPNARGALLKHTKEKNALRR